MRLEKLQEIIGEAKEVNYNGETFTIGLNSTRNFSDVPNGGITQKYDRMGRFQTATLIYMALQLRRFTDKGHGVYIYVKPEFRLDMLLPQAIELSGRSELIKIKLCDSPELLKYRANLPFDKIGKIKFANCASLQEVTYQRKKFKSVTDISNFLKDKMDIIWNMSTDKSVFERGLKDLTLDAAETVLELINSNSLYKGAEFKASLLNFIKYKKEYSKVPEELKESYLF